MSVFSHRLFGNTTSLTIVFAALLALLLSVVSAQVWKDGEAVDSVEHVFVDDGELLENYEHIDQATMTGGTVFNTGRIEEMLYFGGTYLGWMEDEVGDAIGIGTIGTLIVAGEWRAGENWGIIENLIFADNGSGLLVITAFDTPDGISFTDIGAQHIDFMNGRVLLDMSGLGNIRNVLPSSFTNVFGGATVEGMLSAFAVTDGAELFPIIVDGMIVGGWSIDPVTGEIRAPGNVGNFNIGETDGLISYVLDMFSFAGLGGDTAVAEMLGVAVAVQHQAADGGMPVAVANEGQLEDQELVRELVAHFAQDYNRIDVPAGQLSVAAIQAAIDIAAQTVEDDLIIVRMDTFENGVATLRADMVNAGHLRIDICSWSFGGLSIVAADNTGSTVAICGLLDWSELTVYGNTFFNNEQYYAPPDLEIIDLDLEGFVSPMMAEAKTRLGLDTYLADPRFASFKGAGYTTVIIDSGIYAAHNDFSGSKLVYFRDFWDPNNTAPILANSGHGTHVASIAAGWQHGIAQDAGIIALNVFPHTGGSTPSSTIANALQWVVDHVQAGNQYNITNVNLSLGGGNFQTRGNHNSWYDSHLHTLRNFGIIVTAATGNSFHELGPGIGAPAANTSVVSVSSVWNQSGRSFTANGQSFVSQADTFVETAQRGAGLVDIVAPGRWIAAAGITAPGAVANMGGTSMASPVVAGASVLAQHLAGHYLGRYLTVDEFREIIDQTGVTIVDNVFYGYTPTGATYRRIDILAMANAIYVMKGPGNNIVVRNTNNSGTDSLRQAILDAKNGDTITFDPFLNGQTIRISSELLINKNITIDASDLYDDVTKKPGITIDAQGNSRVFNIAAGAIVELAGLTITGGHAFLDDFGGFSDSFGGGICNSGTLTITNSTISGNTAENGGGICNLGASPK